MWLGNRFCCKAVELSKMKDRNRLISTGHEG